MLKTDRERERQWSVDSTWRLSEVYWRPPRRTTVDYVETTPYQSHRSHPTLPLNRTTDLQPQPAIHTDSTAPHRTKTQSTAPHRSLYSREQLTGPAVTTASKFLIATWVGGLARHKIPRSRWRAHGAMLLHNQKCAKTDEPIKLS